MKAIKVTDIAGDEYIINLSRVFSVRKCDFYEKHCLRFTWERGYIKVPFDTEKARDKYFIELFNYHESNKWEY